MISTFVNRDGCETCDILRSALPLALSDKVYFRSSVVQIALSDLSFILLFTYLGPG